MTQRKVIIYKTRTGVEPYVEYVDSLKDREGAAKIRARVTRAALGNLGDHRSVGGGVIELRIHYGPGYRIYCGSYGRILLVLLCAGDKHSQNEDIRKAVGHWQDYRRSV
ncbi:MAG: type II toxin-antitoxin system RelE/ParE family toxin [Elusimicrobiota bacterium]